MTTKSEREESATAQIPDKGKQQAEWSFVSGANAKTFEEREDEREAISRARAGGLARVASQQRLPAIGVGAAGSELRQIFDGFAPHAAGDEESNDELESQPGKREG